MKPTRSQASKTGSNSFGSGFCTSAHWQSGPIQVRNLRPSNQARPISILTLSHMLCQWAFLAGLTLKMYLACFCIRSLLLCDPGSVSRRERCSIWTDEGAANATTARNSHSFSHEDGYNHPTLRTHATGENAASLALLSATRTTPYTHLRISDDSAVLHHSL